MILYVFFSLDYYIIPVFKSQYKYASSAVINFLLVYLSAFDFQRREAFFAPKNRSVSDFSGYMTYMT